MSRTLRLKVDADRAEQAEALAWAHGALAITLADAGDQPLLEPGPGETPIWREITLDAMLPDSADPAGLVLALTAAGMIASPTETRLLELPERDWERVWMDRFQPMRFGRSIWICPSHIEPEADWDVVVRLDPGLAFGTGTHPTTALCLEWMDGIDFESRTVIDYGCGSGVLAVAAALKGATTVFAIDHDPQALTATRDNAERNGVGGRIATGLPGEFEALRGDMVLANILAGPLIELAGHIAGLTRPGGALVLSGILDEQADDVERAYEPLIGKARSVCREGWVRLDFQR